MPLQSDGRMGLESSEGSSGLDVQDGFLNTSLAPHLNWLDQMGTGQAVLSLQIVFPCGLLVDGDLRYSNPTCGGSLSPQ